MRSFRSPRHFRCSVEKDGSVLNKTVRRATSLWQGRERRVEFSNTRGTKLVGDLVDSGFPETIILCHGDGFDRNAPIIRSLAERLDTESKSTLRFDFAGFGESKEETTGARPNGVEDIRAAVLHLRNENRQVTGLIGHSKGAMEALLYSSVYDDIPRVISIAMGFNAARFINSLGPDAWEKLQQFGEISFQFTRDDGTVLTKKVTKEMMDALSSLDMEGALKKIKKTKVLSILGTEDPMAVIDDAVELADCIADRELCVVEGATHNFVVKEHMQTLVDRSAQFLA